MHPTLTMLMVMVVLLASSTFAQQGKGLGWDSNDESDLLHYNIYLCDAVGQNCLLVDQMKHVDCNPIDFTCTKENVLAPGSDGIAFVTAVDTSKNESGESNRRPFDSKAPKKPLNLRVK